MVSAAARAAARRHPAQIQRELLEVLRLHSALAVRPLRHVRRAFLSFSLLLFSSLLESVWFHVLYCTVHVLVLCVLCVQKPWLYAPGPVMWENPPYQHVPSEIYYYYLVETGFYLALSATYFTDVSRKVRAPLLRLHLRLRSHIPHPTSRLVLFYSIIITHLNYFILY